MGKKREGNLFFRRLVYILVILLILSGLILCLYKYFKDENRTYIVEQGTVENFSETSAYSIKSETNIPVKDSLTVIPSVAQDQRVAKDETIAIYQNSKYEDYKSKIEEMDQKIADAIKNLPQTYSNDVSNIDTQIQAQINQMKDVNSYIKMQEYKNTLDELVYNKTMMLGDLSPEGSVVKELISQRNTYEQQSKQSADDIKATTSGAVSYKLDNLEQVADASKILTYSTSDFDNIFSQYNSRQESKFGIKIIDNYLSYLVIKEKKGQNDKYIKVGSNYDIELLDKDNYTISADLIKKIETSDSYYCIFKISNGIENLIDSRQVDVKVSWYKVSGMIVPKSDIKNINGIDYVKVIKNESFVEIPVNVKIESDNMCIVENLSDDDKKAKNITSTDTLGIYDQVVENN